MALFWHYVSATVHSGASPHHCPVHDHATVYTHYSAGSHAGRHRNHFEHQPRPSDSQKREHELKSRPAHHEDIRREPHALRTRDTATSATPNSPRHHTQFSVPAQALTPAQQPRRRILFYHKHKPYYGFTNFSPHAVYHKNKRYPTSEHLFQSFKFQHHRPDIAERIRTCSESPRAAFLEARNFQSEVRRDWRHVNIAKMDEVLYLKFTQHRNIRAELLATGDAELVEDSAQDAFWGIGPDGQGRNELGKALERLRSRLRMAS